MAEENREKAKNKANWVVVIALICFALSIDGMDFQFLSLSLPLLMQEFGINKIAAGALASYTLIGMLVGGIYAGMLADKIGRVKVVGIGFIFFSICTSMLGFTHTYLQFAVLRFLAGIGISAVSTVGPVLATEFVPTAKRTTGLSIVQAGWSVGLLFAALLSSVIMPAFGWRPLFYIAIIPAVAAIFMFKHIPEPHTEPNKKIQRERSMVNMLKTLAADKKVSRQFWLWCVACVFLQFGYYAATAWLPTYVVTDLKVDIKSMSFYVAGNYTAMIVGKVVTGILADKFGRKKMWWIGCLAPAIVAPLLAFNANAHTIVYWLIGLGFAYGMPMAIYSTYIAESSPRRVRGSFFAITYNAGRIGSIISPIVIGAVAMKYTVGLGIATLGVTYLISALIPGIWIQEKMYDPARPELDETYSSTKIFSKHYTWEEEPGIMLS
jgi:Arabinose efflux permease